jgi:hypothetical protein
LLCTKWNTGRKYTIDQAKKLYRYITYIYILYTQWNCCLYKPARLTVVLKSTIICFCLSSDGEVTIRLPVFCFVVATSTGRVDETPDSVISTKCIFTVFIIIIYVFLFHFCGLINLHFWPTDNCAWRQCYSLDWWRSIDYKSNKMYDGYCMYDGQYNYWLQIVCVSLLFILALLSCHLRIVVLLSCFPRELD